MAKMSRAMIILARFLELLVKHSRRQRAETVVQPSCPSYPGHFEIFTYRVHGDTAQFALNAF